MNWKNRVEPAESTEVNSSTTRLRRLYIHFRKRRFTWIIFFIIVLVIIIVIPTIIVTGNKIKKEETSTIEITTIATATEESTTGIIMTSGLLTTTEEQLLPPVIVSSNTTWKQNASTVAGGNGHGSKLNQLEYPWGIYVDDDDHSIYIADTVNNRIVRWEFGADKGEIVAGENGREHKLDRLFHPTDVILDKEKKYLIICDQANSRVVKWSRQNSQDQQILIHSIGCQGLAMDNNGDLYISDCENHRVIRWQDGDKKGTPVAGGNGEGNEFNQLSCPGYIFVDKNHSVYVADQGNDRVMKWMKNAIEGILIAPEQISDKIPSSMVAPTGVIIDYMGNVYVSKFASHQIIRWLPGAIEGTPVVGEKEDGSEPTHLSHPHDLSFDRQGNLYVVDHYNARIQKFDIDLD